MPIEIVALAGQTLEPAVSGIVATYRQAFAPPPYRKGEADVQGFARTFPLHALQWGFRCCVARDVQTGAVVGFAYGYGGAQGQWWHDIVTERLSATPAASWVTNAFDLAELAVSPQFQGYGIGGRLHDTLLTGLPQRQALLSTAQVETAALHLYRRRGWVRLSERFTFPGSTDLYLILGLDLIAFAARQTP